MPTPKNPNTSAATVASVAARRRVKHDKWAAEMRPVGWIVAEPGVAGAAEALVAAITELSRHMVGSDLAAMTAARAAVEPFRYEED